MPTPQDTLSQHAQLFRNSCAAWGLEFLLKVEGKIGITDYPLQNKWPNGCGFGPSESQLLRDKGLNPREASFLFPDFETHVASRAAKGLGTIFTVPDHYEFDPIAQKWGLMLHTWAVIPQAKGYTYGSRGPGIPAPLPQLQLKPLYDFLRASTMPDWKIHTYWCE